MTGSASNLDDALAEALKDISRTFGAGSVLLGEREPESVETIPTGSAALDDALGVGGIPRGRLTEVFGPEAAGKSTTVYHMLSEAQKLGPCALIDAEHSFDPKYAQRIGVDIDALLFSQPMSSEESWEIAQRLVASHGLVMLAIDSLAVLLPQAELNGEAGEAHVGLKARQIGQAMRRIVPEAKRANTALVLVNQVREAIGVIYGSPIVVPGGKAPKFAATIRIECKRGQLAKRAAGPPVKQEIKWKVVKNKVAPPYREAAAWIIFGEGLKEKR